MSARLFYTDPETIEGLQLEDFLATDEFATVVWSPSQYASSKYSIRWWSDDNQSVTDDTNVPVYTIPKLRPGRRYWIQVAIEHQVYCKPLSFLTAPGIVENVAVERASKSSYNIIWDPVHGTRKYVIKLQRTNKSSNLSESTTTDYNFYNLDLGYTYVCSVAATNNGGTGAFSKPVKFHTDLSGPDVIENDVTYAKDEAIAEVCFTPSTCENVTRYKVELMNEEEEIVAEKSVQKPSAVFKKLDSGVCYTPVIVAETKEGIQSDKTFGKSFWTKPQKVFGVKTEAETKTIERVKWKSVQGARSYSVVFGDLQSTMGEEETQDNEILLTNLQPATQHFVRISANGRGGSGRPSDKVFFQTALDSPQYVHLTDISDGENRCLLAEWQLTEGAAEYHVDIIDVKKNYSTRRQTEKNYFEFKDLQPGTEYKVTVQAIAEKGSRNSTIVHSSSKWTRPPVVKDFCVRDDSMTSRLLSWRKVPDATYNVRVQKAGGSPEILQSATNEFHLGDLEYHSKYTVSVTAKNEVEGEESERIEFETALFHPTNVHAETNSTTSVAVKFSEPKIPANRYQIRTITIHGKTVKTEVVTRQQSLLRILLDGLQPGSLYQIAVRSLHDDKPRLNSKETISEVVQTKMPALQLELKKISGNAIGLKWKPLTGADSYKICLREEYQEWQERDENGNEAFLRDLKYGTRYEIKVAAINSVGTGEESCITPFSTVPPRPEGLNAEYLTPSQVKVWCDKVSGAEIYVFKVNDDIYKSESPSISPNIATETLKISVSAENSDKESSAQSETIVFEQTLFRLHKKFRKTANNKFTFIPPEFQDLTTGDIVSDCGTTKFCIDEGETLLILGECSTGKTSCCFNYLQSLPPDKLAFYLDYEDFKYMRQNVDVEGILGKCMTDLPPDRVESVLSWIKNHSNYVVFIIDNFELPAEFQGFILQYGNKNPKEHIFSNLLSTKREIFPDSQVLCTSTQQHIQSLVNPTGVLKIMGFRDQHVQKMMSNILGDENANVQLPSQLRYFSTNPCYCNAILQLWKTDHDVNTESYASVLIKVLSDSIERYPEQKKKEKLIKLANEVDEFERIMHLKKINPEKPINRDKGILMSDTTSQSSIMSDVPSFIDIQFQKNFEGNSCQSLRSSIVSALYFGYFCSQKNLKPLFKKGRFILGNMVNMWTMAIGLMRPELEDLAVELFKPIDKKSTDVSKKLKALKDFIKKNIQDIQSQVSQSHQTVLDWFNVIVETGDKELISESKRKLKIGNSMSLEERTEIAEFLERIPGNFCPFIEVMYAIDLKDDHRLQMDMAIGNNPSKDLIKVTEMQPTSVFPGFGSLHRRKKKPTDLTHQSKSILAGDLNQSNSAQHADPKPTSNTETYSFTGTMVTSEVFKVDSKGGVCSIRGCQISIPPDAFKSEEELTFSLDFKVRRSKDDRIQIAPILHCNPCITLEKRATIHLPSWCLTSSEKVLAYVVAKTYNEDEKEIERTPLCTAEGFIKFEATELGTFCAHINKLFFNEVKFFVESSLFCHPTEGKMSLIFYVSHASSLYRGKYKEIASPLNAFIAKPDKPTLVALTVEEPSLEQFRILPNDPQTFRIDEDFVKNLYHRIPFSIVPFPTAKQTFTVKSMVGNDEGIFDITWPCEGSEATQNGKVDRLM